MTLDFPSEQWIQELSRLLNANESYEKSASKWEGDFLFVVEPDENIHEPVYMYLDLYHGKSPSAGHLNSLEERKTAYKISAPYKTWRKVIEGKLDPIQGMMTRALKLEGNLMQIMRYPKATKEIISCCAKIPTNFLY